MNLEYFMYYYGDLILIALIILIPLIAQYKIKSAYNKYAKVMNSTEMTGKEVAEKILAHNGLNHVKIERVAGSLSDHYDPTRKTVNLSDEIYGERTVSACAVAAHECGHAMQDKEGYFFMRFRHSLVPIVNFTSKISTIILMIGIIISFTDLILLGCLLMCGSLLFQLVTLPVEFDASRRAKQELKKIGLINNEDEYGTKKVLKAAALTYVANFLATAAQILRYIALFRRRRK